MINEKTNDHSITFSFKCTHKCLIWLIKCAYTVMSFIIPHIWSCCERRRSYLLRNKDSIRIWWGDANNNRYRSKESHLQKQLSNSNVWFFFRSFEVSNKWMTQRDKYCCCFDFTNTYQSTTSPTLETFVHVDYCLFFIWEILFSKERFVSRNIV